MVKRLYSPMVATLLVIGKRSMYLWHLMCLVMILLPPKCEVYVYRMTMSNDDGDVVEMSPEQMRLRCDQMGVKYVPVFEKLYSRIWVDEIIGCGQLCRLANMFCVRSRWAPTPW